MTGQQRERQDGHGHQHDGRHRDRRGAAAEQAGAGPPGAGHPVVEQEGVVRPRPAGLARPGRGHQAGRTLPDGRPVVAPPVVPVRAVVLIDPGVGEHGRAQRDPHRLGPAGVGRVGPAGGGRVGPAGGRVGRLRPGVPGGGVPRRCCGGRGRGRAWRRELGACAYCGCGGAGRWYCGCGAAGRCSHWMPASLQSWWDRCHGEGPARRGARAGVAAPGVAVRRGGRAGWRRSGTAGLESGAARPAVQRLGRRPAHGAPASASAVRTRIRPARGGARAPRRPRARG